MLYKVAKAASKKMARISDVDIAVAILIALILIAVALVIWPGFVRVRPRTLAGFWASQKSGALHEIRPSTGRTIIVSTKNGPAPGATWGVRGVRVAIPGEGMSRIGRVELGGRQITWRDGDTWLVQGVR